MMQLWILLAAAYGLALPGVAWLGLRCARMEREVRRADASCRAARQGEEQVTRALQLFAHELQALALTFRGHVDRLSAERHPHAPSIAAASAQLGSLADELGHHLIPAGQLRVLSCETIALDELVAEAVSAIEAAISPGRRHWRIAHPPGRTGRVILWADRRALRLVLVRVLGEAVRSSAHDDWIDIGWSIGPSGLTICVEDEGAGTALPTMALAALAAERPDSRGIGLRLSLARSLTQAHGGLLEVEALARIGTRVAITLPPDRLHRTAPKGAGSGPLAPDAAGAI